ncbi:hypothetical protein ACQPW1_13225 [Nocardia sp. CA-128927]
MSAVGATDVVGVAGAGVVPMGGAVAVAVLVVVDSGVVVAVEFAF